MVSSELNTLGAFLIAAEERSFTKAARRLGVSPSAVSHTIRGLEERLGVRLLSRTTRNVSPTEAGQELLVRLRPAFTDIEHALDKLSGLRDKPVGRVRLVTPRLAAMMVLAPKLKNFARDYPDIVLDVTTDESPMDIVAGGYDAGIHFGEYIQKDMIAVRVSGDQRAAIVGSPAYFKSNPKPKTPRELTSHRGINYRHGAGGEVYRWEFEKGKKELSVAVNGPLIVDDVELLVRAPLTASDLPSCRRNSRRRLLPRARSCACWTTGASRSLDSSSITRAGGSNRRRSLH
jgi:DNA-binding transcriptional LysR family regulator